MKINNTEVDTSKLLSRQELMDILRENGESDRALAQVRERYFEDFNDEMMWRFPLSDGCHMGTYIILVKEGIISIPYDMIDKEEYEIFELEDASMIDAKTAGYFIDDWQTYSEMLIGVLKDIQEHLKSVESDSPKEVDGQ